MGYEVYWVDGWNARREEPRGAAVKLTDEVFESAGEAYRYAALLSPLAGRRYWPGHAVVLDDEGRRQARPPGVR